VELLVAFLVLLTVIWFVTVPLRRVRESGEAKRLAHEARIADLEARKESKYREIRDAELDREQGKLSADDFRRLDAELRRDAIEILKDLDRERAEDARDR